jgi:hypothetical protein
MVETNQVQLEQVAEAYGDAVLHEGNLELKKSISCVRYAVHEETAAG